MKVVANRHHRVNDDYAPAVGDRIAASAKNAIANIVVPVVDDAFEHVGICALGHSLEEISANYLAAIEHARRLQVVRLRDDLGLIEQYASRGSVGLQDFREQPAASTAYVDDAPKLAEIIRARDDGVLRVGHVCHPAVEAYLGIRMSAEIIEETDSMNMPEGTLAGLNVVQEVAVCGPFGRRHSKHCVPQNARSEQRSGGR